MSLYSIISIATFFLFLSPPRSGVVAIDSAVLDTKGRPLRAKSMYYILPATQGQGGGLTMSPRNKTTFCPLFVAQLNQEVYPGLPVWFLPENSKQRLISLSSDLNILFNTVNICLQSAGWKITIDYATRRKYVAMGGAIGDPGEETVSSWFKIEKVGSGSYYYKIVFCPNVCPFCMVMCGDLGVFVLKDGTRLLGLSDHPFYVMFKKA